MQAFWTVALAALATQVPVLIVWIVGVILAIVTWKRHPRASLLTLIALLVLFVITVAASLLNNLYPLLANRSGLPASRIAIVLGITGILHALFSAACWGMLIAAIFGKRPASA